MSITVQKGNGFSGQYVDAVIATATDWTGTATVYSGSPGGYLKFSVALSISLDGTKLLFTLPAGDILNLDAGVYAIVGNIKSTTLAIDSYRVDYITVTDVVVSDQPMTTLSITLLKLDGTPAGKETRVLVNSNGATTIVLGWAGVPISASIPIADAVSGDVIDTEIITTATNAAGYAEFNVVKGQTVTVTCPYFSKVVTVDTTGFDSIDLSTFF